MTLTGAQLERVLADQLPQLVDGRRGLFGVSGIRVAVTCDGADPRVRVTRDSGVEIAADETLTLAVASYSAGRAAWAAVDGEPTVAAHELPVLVRDAVAAWLLERGGHLDAADFAGTLAAAAAGSELRQRLALRGGRRGPSPESASVSPDRGAASNDAQCPPRETGARRGSELDASAARVLHTNGL